MKCSRRATADSPNGWYGFLKCFYLLSATRSKFSFRDGQVTHIDCSAAPIVLSGEHAGGRNGGVRPGGGNAFASPNKLTSRTTLYQSIAN